MATAAVITRLFLKVNVYTFLLYVYHLNINTYSEVEICSYESVTSALNGAPSSDIFAPGKKDFRYLLNWRSCESVCGRCQTESFFPPENAIPILQTVAIPRRLGGCLCTRIGPGVLVKRQAAVKYPTPIFLAPTVTLRTQMGPHTRMKSSGSL